MKPNNNTVKVLRMFAYDVHAKNLTCTSTFISKRTGIRLDSLSSLLKKMCDARLLNRIPGIGPRGGFGYYLNSPASVL